MKKKNFLFYVLAVLLSALILGGCGGSSGSDIAARPLWTPDGAGAKTVVISDLHLGVSDDFAENVANRPLLVEFLQRLQLTPDVKELVIAGDFLDEWYLPMSYPAYSDSDEFYRQAAKNNQTVMDELKNVMAKGIKVVYVPGNHDQLLTAGVLAELLPGVVQARDSVQGLGTWRTGASQDVAIEHGHRYDVFSGPDFVSNKSICGDKAALPPGYFYARYAASWVAEWRPSVSKDYPEISSADVELTSADQRNAYYYYLILSSELNRMTPREASGDKTFDLGVAGFNGKYSVQDFYPLLKDGRISSPLLYQGFQTEAEWNERQARNLVPVSVDFGASALGATGYKFLESQAKAQYLENPAGGANVVIFGHDHIPQYLKLADGKIYINTGTWVDHNTACADGTSRTFAVIPRQTPESAALYQYGVNGQVTDVSEIMVRK
jgi:UDP-2,3-diacylglucosamine pyrophosphatase LpxH